MADRKHKKIIQENFSNEQYIASSIIRFGRLQNYIQEKLLIDNFAIKGNLLIAEGLRRYMQNNLKDLQKKENIKILDVGPAIGAISTLICLQTLNEFNLMDKAKIYLLDVSSKVIEQTQLCDFFYPSSVIDPELKSKIFKKLRESKGEVGSAENILWKNNYFDIVLAGFLFHHLHNDVKPIVAKELMRVLTPKGFLGIAEEWFKNYEKDYAVLHKNDEIPLAYESIISFKKLFKLFPNFQVIFKTNVSDKKNFYTFCGTKI